MKRYILVFFIGFIISFSPALQAQEHKKNEQPSMQPKLVVGIVIDQMRSDYIYRFWSKLGENGFKKLVNEGFECSNTQYNYVPTYTGPGHTSIYTGTTPETHGIIGNNWYVKSSGVITYCAVDTTVHAIGGSEKAGQMSPHNLLSTTIGDELYLFSNLRSKVIGISMKDRGAIFPAGFSGQAYWFDNLSNNFITSTYYRKDSLPVWLQRFNGKNLPQQYLSEVWKPLLDIKEYTESTADDTEYENGFDTAAKARPVFNYDLSKLKSLDPDLLRTTPFGNTLTKELAIATIEGEKLGEDNFCDLLSVSFSSTDDVGHEFGINAIETEDIYLRLDKEIAALLEYLDTKFGKENVLVFLTADHGAMHNPVFLNDNKIPGGVADGNLIRSRIKKLLQKNYGDTSIFRFYINNQIYLDDITITTRNLDKEKIMNDLRSELLTIHFIADIFTESSISSTDYIYGIKGMVRRGFNIKRSGDMCIVYQPGYMKTYGGKKITAGTEHGSPFRYDTMVPLYWYGWKIRNGATVREINITDIAATLSALLKICQPSGCSGKPIVELFSK
ncbi:MAG: alkaline phosphatase PafA [Bacteroidota bacterium]